MLDYTYVGKGQKYNKRYSKTIKMKITNNSSGFSIRTIIKQNMTFRIAPEFISNLGGLAERFAESILGSFLN